MNIKNLNSDMNLMSNNKSVYLTPILEESKMDTSD